MNNTIKILKDLIEFIKYDKVKLNMNEWVIKKDLDKIDFVDKSVQDKIFPLFEKPQDICDTTFCLAGSLATMQYIKGELAKEDYLNLIHSALTGAFEVNFDWEEYVCQTLQISSEYTDKLCYLSNWPNDLACAYEMYESYDDYETMKEIVIERIKIFIETI